MTHVEGVAGARVVHVVKRVGGEAVVGRVVDAAEAQRRAQVVALGGVVVDHVKDDLDARLVQGTDHRLELGHLLPACALGGVAVVRGEEPDGVVSPVVRQPTLDEVVVVDELVHGHQLHRGDTQALQVLHHGRVGQAGVGAAQLRWQLRMADR